MSLASRKLIQATAGATTVDTGDDDFANVVLLLDGDGTSDDNNNTFTDSSTNGYTVTESGSVVQGSFSPYGDNWSNYFNDDGYLQVTKSTDLDLDTNNWTIECWLNLKSASAVEVVLNFGYETETTRGYLIYLNSDGTLHFAYSTNGSNNTDTSMGSHGIVANEWTHLAVVRNGSTITGYINGSALGTTINIGSSDIYYPTSGNFRIGSDATNNLAGYMSNLRLVNGTAVYTSNFTPSTSPLTNITNTKLLMCQSNRFADNSSSSHAIAVGTGTPKVTPFSPFKDSDARDITTDGGSAYFNYGPYLTLPQKTAFNFGTGDFTVEFWANVDTYRTSGSYYDAFLTFGFYTSSPYFRINHDGRLACGLVSGEYYSTSTIDTGEWNHYAISRSGTTLRIFVNGTLETTATHSASLGNSAAVTVGTSSWQANNEEMKGYLSDVRIVKGSAVYTSSFTPPTAPLTAVTNTSALLSFQDAGIYDRSGINNLDTVGDARLGFAPIYGTGSLAFDGTGDYLSVQNENDLFTVGSGDYTVECWINTSDTVGEIVSAFSQSSPFPGWLFGIGFPEHDGSKNGLLSFYQANSTNNETKYSTARVDDGSWHHVAISKSGTTLRFFIDGALDSTHTLSYVSTGSGQPIRIGADNNTGPVRYLDGYIDDLRITKGVARYTSAFTAPNEIDLSTDTYAEYVTLFLDGDGTVNGQNNTFTDSSTNDFTVTESGSVVQGGFSPYGDNWSNYFSCSSYVSFPDSNDWNIGSAKTLEAWVKFDSVSGSPFIMGQSDNIWLSVNWTAVGISAGKFGASFRTSSSTWVNISSTTSATVNEWYHIAVTWDGTYIKMYINGALEATSSDLSATTWNSSTDTWDIGGWNGNIGTYGMTGYVSNARVTNSVVYTSSFTPSTSKLSAITNTVLLTCQSNRFLDNSTNNATATAGGTPKVSRFSPFESDKPYDITTDGGSGDFNGSEYLTVATDSNLSFSNYAGDFTVEAWFYPTAVAQSGGSYIWFQGATGTGYSPFIIYQNPNTYNFTIYASSNGSSWNLASGVTIGTAQANAWNHIAIVRDGTNIKCYMNGVLGSTTAVSTTAFMTTTGNVVVGSALGNANTYLRGYVSNLRAVKGSVVYSSAFTPPTTLMTAITNTELLLNFQDSAIPDLSGINNIDTVGNAKVGGTDPTKYGSNAMAFDGTGDYIQPVVAASELALGTGDFTIEFWMYPTSVDATIRAVLSNRYDGASNNVFACAFDNGTGTYGFGIYFHTQATGVMSTGVSPTVNTWQHLAFVRSNGTLYIYKDGTSIGTPTSFTSDLSYTVPPLIGKDGVRTGGGTASNFVGYLDDLRITKGVARYTANFTPPDAALPKF